MSAHARLAPSSAHRWMSCPGSVRLVESLYGGVPHVESEFALEGTRAHTIAEIMAAKAFGLIDHLEYERRFKTWQEDAPPDQWEDMLRHANAYVELLRDYTGPEHVLMLEQRVDTGIPESWGTADAAIAGPRHIRIVDYKYGIGVRVEAYQNPQLMEYALGVLDREMMVQEIDTVAMTIHQPRIGHISHYEVTTKALLAWREAVAIPAARLALSDDAHFAPSEEACRFCPAAGDCRARLKYMTERDFGNPDAITPAELGEALHLLPDLSNWAKAVEKRALQLVDSGTAIPGWKRVRSGGRRQIVDQEKAMRVLARKGYTQKMTVKKSLRPLGELERMVGGKTRLEGLLGPLLAKTEGRESLVPDTDPRPEIDPNSDAAKDFT